MGLRPDHQGKGGQDPGKRRDGSRARLLRLAYFARIALFGRKALITVSSVSM
jgi:hypothetical protein